MLRRIGILAGGFAALAAGCSQQEPAQAPPSPPPATTRTAPRDGGRGMETTRQAAFLARIKQAARANGVIQEARMRGDNELGVVLSRQVKLDKVEPLLTGLLREMRDEFPGRQLTIIAYAPNNKPLATMRYDPSAPPNRNKVFTPNFR